MTVKMATPSENFDMELDEELILLLLMLKRRRNRRRAKGMIRRIWTKPWISKRIRQGAYFNLIQELSTEDPEQFRQFHRLDRKSFDDVLALVGPAIVKRDTNMRFAISPSERLAVTLRFLATGETFRSLSFQFRIGERTVSAIVEETCQALYSTMKDQYLKTPSSAHEWLQVAEGFDRKWQYPCCIGAIDGKHIAIQQPDNSGSEFFNYKHFFSVLLMAVVDADYKFLYVDVGASGRSGDAGVFSESNLKKALDSNLLNIPPPAQVPGIQEAAIHHHIVADDAFPLSKHIMKPCPHRHLDRQQRIFNYRLSRARRTVENAFGIFANRFRVFLTTIKLNPETVTSLILAACCLHNYMVEKNKHLYTSVADVENADHTFCAGSWRHDPPLLGDTTTSNRNPPRSAKDQRQHLIRYFSTTGSVPWQNNI